MNDHRNENEWTQTIVSLKTPFTRVISIALETPFNDQ